MYDTGENCSTMQVTAFSGERSRDREQFMKKVRKITVAIAVFAGFLYIRYQRIDIEIARFDCMMKAYKGEHRSM